MPTHRALIYEIYPNSYGDLKTIASRLPEIAKILKPDYIWLSPIYVSPWHEGGYDVADYEAIDPRFGTMSDFRNLIKAAEKHQIGVLMDLVLNHTSTEHEWFIKSERRDPYYSDYYIWLEKSLNWRSFFGGTAYEYDDVRGEYYLHLFDKSQPDLNFKNPRVIKEFEKIINFWRKKGVAGFRVDSANVLSESKLRRGFLPGLPGFSDYYETKQTLKVLNHLFTRRDFFAIAEPIGGVIFTRHKLRELTDKSFDAAFNIGTLDVADTFFSEKTHPLPVNYKRWLKKLARWSTYPTFSLALESHDTPRAPSRFSADPKALAMLQFLLPINFPCIYQGQELGLRNPELPNDINKYPGIQSRAVYSALLAEGETKKQAMQTVHRISRDNARAPYDWSLFRAGIKSGDSVLNFYKTLIDLWKTDEVLIKGDLKVQNITKHGVMDFTRTYNGTTYKIHLDLPAHTPSTLSSQNDTTLLTTAPHI
jgi:glycosidase